MSKAAKVIVYEIRSEGKVLAQFSDEKKALREMKKLRKAGSNVRVYSTWVDPSRAPKEPPKEKKGSRGRSNKSNAPNSGPSAPAGGKCTESTMVNAWLTEKGLVPVQKDMTFHDLYVAVVVDLKTMDEAVGECRGRKAELIRGIVEAMNYSTISVRYIENILRETEKRRKSQMPTERWIGALGWAVPITVAIDLVKYWRGLNEAFFLGAYKNGVPCEPPERTSDLSVQPTQSGLALCYRELSEDRIYFVLKEIEWVKLTDSALEISGKLSDDSDMTYSFTLINDERKDLKSRRF